MNNDMNNIKNSKEVLDIKNLTINQHTAIIDALASVYEESKYNAQVLPVNHGDREYYTRRYERAYITLKKLYFNLSSGDRKWISAFHKYISESDKYVEARVKRYEKRKRVQNIFVGIILSIYIIGLIILFWSH